MKKNVVFALSLCVMLCRKSEELSLYLIKQSTYPSMSWWDLAGTECTLKWNPTHNISKILKRSSMEPNFSSTGRALSDSHSKFKVSADTSLCGVNTSFRHSTCVANSSWSCLSEARHSFVACWMICATITPPIKMRKASPTMKRNASR